MERQRHGPALPRPSRRHDFIGLYAVNKQVKFVPYMTTSFILADTSITDQHWSVRNAIKKR